MSDLIPFHFERHEIRVHTDNDGNPWWVLKDICDVLGLHNTSEVAYRLEPEESMSLSFSDTLHSELKILLVNEPGLYRLIFRSNKAEAKRFQDWVFTHVLPTLRKTGQFHLTPAQLNAHFLGPAPLSWEKRFELDFFQAVCRVYRQRVPTNDKHSPMLAWFIRKYIYGVMPQEVFAEMDALNPITDKKTGKRRLRLHQLLKLERIGDFLITRINTVMDILLACTNLGKETFAKLMAERDKQKPLKVAIGINQHTTVTIQLPYQATLF